MGFGCKVNDTVKAFLGKEPLEKRGVSYITTNKPISLCQLRSKVFEVSRITCVGKCIKVNNALIWFNRKATANKVCANKAGTTGY